jgi:hypothetical protein
VHDRGIAVTLRSIRLGKAAITAPKLLIVAVLASILCFAGFMASESTAQTTEFPAAGIAAGGLEYWSSADVDRELNDYSRLHATWVRHDFPWNVMEPIKGQFRFSGFDRWVIAARQRHISVVATLGYTPAWANGGHADSRYAPSSARAFALYAGRTAAHFERLGVDVYEIWNEPNVSYWQPSPDPQRYTAILCAAYRAIHAVDPDATVLTGGISPAANVAATAVTPATYSPQTWLADIYADGGGHCFDGVAYHPYVDSVQTHGELGGNWYLMYTGDYASTLRGLMVAHGDRHKRIWATEVGCNRQILGDSECSYRLGEALALWRRYVWAAVLCWFTYSDNQAYGLVTRENGDRIWKRSPEWSAFSAAAGKY